MEMSVKCFCIMGLLVAIYGLGSFNSAYADGSKCPSPDMEAMKLVPCLDAAKDENKNVNKKCCNVVNEMVKKPDCLCAVLLSDLAKNSGVNLKVALTIPKRCNIATRPVGYKCGDYILP